MGTEHLNEEDIFRNAIQFENRDEQARYVKEACGNDVELYNAIESLLQHHYANSILDAPAFEAGLLDEGTAVTEAPGTIIGRYKLLERIGEGGMAVVYMAEQEQPIRRKVALKIIKLGMDTKQVIARFEAERQALALMDHPNIAKVLDAGATETGRPYFVMELVKGASITDYCDANNLGTEERLNLFTEVCNAVQHAHQKGIIHRDIKPSNVMVALQDDKPVPKVIDFGIAKATNQRLTEKTVFTRYAQMIGTPAYMSPEQAELSDLDIDTRTDIYSLGVLLYELLTGTTPFSEEELRQAGYIEMQRIIAKQEPTKPSTKLNTLGETLTDVAKHRNSTPDLLRKTIRGDLDWIVMKALEKHRDKRYNTASEFSADIDRHLNHQPVQAAAPSLSYRTSKFVRRHRTGVLVILLASLALIAILSALSTATLLIWREQSRTQQALEREQKALTQETQTRQEAERQKQIAEDVLHFLNHGILAWVDPSKTRGRQITVRETLEVAARNIKGAFDNDPLVEASVRLTLGEIYTQIGEYTQAAQQLEEARRLHQEHLAQEDPAAIQSMVSLGRLYIDQGRYSEAELLLLKARETSEQALGHEHPRTLSAINVLAVLYKSQGQYEKAEPLYLKVVEVDKRVFGENHLNTLNVMHNLAALYNEQRRYAEAEELYGKVLEIRQGLFGEDHPDTLRTMANLANLCAAQGRHSQAETLHLKTLDIRERVLGKEHPDTLGSMNNLAVLYFTQGRFQEAESLYLKTLEVQGRVLGEEHPDTLNSLHNLALLRAEQGRFQEAEPLYLKTLETRERVLGKGHPDTIKVLNLLVSLYDAWDKPQEAQKWRAKLSENESPSQESDISPEKPSPPSKDGVLAEARLLVTSGAKASWSPDGTHLVFCRREQKGLQILDIESGATRDLTSSGKDPAWSPDGRFIAYVQGRGASDETWLVTSTGESPRKIMDGGYPSWSPDGKTLYIHSRKENGIFAIAVDKPDAEPEMFYNSPGAWFPAISPDRERIAVGRKDALVILDRRTAHIVLVWPTPGHRGLLPAWSPDGKQVGFGGFDNEPFGVWVLDVEAREAVQVAEGPYTMPAWSPDGTKLAFDLRSKGVREVWVVETQAIQGPKVSAAEAAKSGKSLTEPGIAETGPSAASPAAKLLIGQIPPAFKLQDLNGQQVILSDFKGKVVLLDFWATWCPPCVKVIPHLEVLHNKYKDEGLVVIGLNDEADHTKVRQFTEKHISYVVLLDAKRQFSEYGIRAIPTLFYIDRTGTVRHQETGFVEGKENQIEARIKELLVPGPNENSPME